MTFGHSTGIFPRPMAAVKAAGAQKIGGTEVTKSPAARETLADMRIATSDSDLLAEYRLKDSERAFHVLVERYQQMVLGTAWRRTGNLETARDVAQRVFAALARKAGLLIGRSSVAGWLHQAAVYEAMRAAQAEARIHARNVPLADEAVYSISQPAKLPTPERWVALEEAIDSLPAPDREVLVLHYFQDLSYEEMALTLGLNEPAVRKRASRALERLSGALRQRGIAGNAKMLLVAAAAVQSTVIVPASFAQASLAAAGAGAGASAFLTLTALLSQLPLKTIATILALASLPALWLAPPEGKPPGRATMAAAHFPESQTLVAVETPRASRGNSASNSEAAPPEPAATRIADGEDISAVTPAFAPAAGFGGAFQRIESPSLPRSIGVLPAPPVVTIPGARIAVATRAATSVKPQSAGAPSLREPATSALPQSPGSTAPPPASPLAELELRPAAAAAFLGKLIDELLVLKPLERTSLTAFLDQQFAALNVAGLAGAQPLDIAPAIWRTQREAAITEIVQGAREIVPATAAIAPLVTEILSVPEPAETTAPLTDASSAVNVRPEVSQATEALTKITETAVENLVPALAPKLGLLQ